MCPILEPNYRNRQDVVLRRRSVGWALCVASALGCMTSGCMTSNSARAEHARHVPLAHLSELPEAERGAALAKLPVVLEIRKGDRFPVEVLIDSRLLKLDAPAPWALEAREDFFVLLNEAGPPALSEDGVDFDTRPKNTFSFGVEAVAGKPPAVHLVLGLRAGGEKPR